MEDILGRDPPSWEMSGPGSGATVPVGGLRDAALVQVSSPGGSQWSRPWLGRGATVLAVGDCPCWTLRCLLLPGSQGDVGMLGSVLAGGGRDIPDPLSPHPGLGGPTGGRDPVVNAKTALHQQHLHTLPVRTTPRILEVPCPQAGRDLQILLPQGGGPRDIPAPACAINLMSWSCHVAVSTSLSPHPQGSVGLSHIANSVSLWLAVAIPMSVHSCHPQAAEHPAGAAALCDDGCL